MLISKWSLHYKENRFPKIVININRVDLDRFAIRNGGEGGERESFVFTSAICFLFQGGDLWFIPLFPLMNLKELFVSGATEPGMCLLAAGEGEKASNCFQF